MKYLLFISLIFIGCEKSECWQCDLMYQKTDELIKSVMYCDKDWSEIIDIANRMNTQGITYTHCKKQ